MHRNVNTVSDKTEEPRKYDISYFSVFLILYFHVAGLFGAYLCVTRAKWMSIAFTAATHFLGTAGVVMGAHKLWSHRSFKATRALEVFLMLCQSMAFQFTVYKWVRLHRLHHLHSDTPSDPHDATRGLFYSHIGWLMIRKPGGDLSSVSMEDIEANPVIDFQRRHTTWFLPTVAFILPTTIPLLWGEDLWTSWHINLFRFVITLNLFCAANSVSHTWGYRPYDRRFKACQSWPIILLTFGEGCHNFHHAFPFDYRSTEKGWMNVWAAVLDVCAKIGIVYDLREAGEDIVRMRKEMRGDGSN